LLTVDLSVPLSLALLVENATTNQQPKPDADTKTQRTAVTTDRRRARGRLPFSSNLNLALVYKSINQTQKTKSYLTTTE
jgi:hypothetical protein